MSKKSYVEKLKDPRWQKKRLEILSLDGWKCRNCSRPDKTLNVHHLGYENDKEPWEYPNEWLLTLCEDCHEEAHNIDWQRAFRDLNLCPQVLLYIALKMQYIITRDLHLYDAILKKHQIRYFSESFVYGDLRGLEEHEELFRFFKFAYECGIKYGAKKRSGHG